MCRTWIVSGVFFLTGIFSLFFNLLARQFGGIVQCLYFSLLLGCQLDAFKQIGSCVFAFANFAAFAFFVGFRTLSVFVYALCL